MAQLVSERVVQRFGQSVTATDELGPCLKIIAHECKTSMESCF